MGRRSRKRREEPELLAQTAPPAPKTRLSSEERNERARASLEPLAPGERPGAVTVAAIVAALLAAGNLVLVAVGYEVTSAGTDSGGAGGAILFAAILAVAAGGMWTGRYWAVLGFQALLAITALYATLSLFVASNVWGALLSITVLASASYLFYKLINAMARLQMPSRRPG